MDSAGGEPFTNPYARAGDWAYHRLLVVLLLAYVLLSSALATALPLSEAIKAALATPALAIIPLLIGAAALRTLGFLRDAPTLDGASRALVDWLAGTIIIVTLAVALHLGGQAIVLQRFGFVTLALATTAAIALFRYSARPSRMRVNAVALLAVGGAILLAMTPKLIAAQATPFPLLSDNFLDAFHFSQPALRLLDHGYLELNNRSHPPAVVVLLASLVQLYDTEPLSIMWMAPFLLFAAFAAGLALWGHAVSRRWTTGLLVTVVGLFILTGNSAFSGTPLALRSNRVLFALFPLGLYLTHRLVSTEAASRRSKVEALLALQGVIGVLFVVMSGAGVEARVPVMLVVAAVLGLALHTANERRWHWPGMPALFAIIVAAQLFHVFEAPVYLTAMMVYGLALTLRGVRFEETVAAGVCAAGGGLFVLQYTGIVSYPQDFSLSSAVFESTYAGVSMSVAARIALLDSVLAPVVIGLLLLGALACLTGRAGTAGRAIAISAAAMFFVYLLPDAFAYRTNKAMVPFLAFLAVAGADGIAGVVMEFPRRLNVEMPLTREMMKIGLVAAALPALMMPFINYTTLVLPGETHRSVISDVEYELGEWFEESTDENIRIISDYQTMLVLSSLSNKVSISERRYLDIEMSDEGRDQMAFIKGNVLRAEDGCTAYAAVRSLAGGEPPRELRFLNATDAGISEPQYYVVWTAKTFLWSEHGLGVTPLRKAQGSVYPAMVEPFLDSRFFRLAAIIGDEAYVFQARSAPIDQPAAASASPPGLMSEVLGVTSPPGDECVWSP